MKNGSAAEAETAVGSNARREFYSAKEVASKIGVHYDTLLRWARDRKRRKSIPPFKRFGPRCLKFPIDQYDLWAQAEK